MPIPHERAFELAARLKTIPGCPQADEAIDALADDLVEFCQGEDEATWLVREARMAWQRWSGTAGLIELLNSHRPSAPVPVPPLLDEAEAIERGLIRPPCPNCDDSGYTGTRPNIKFCCCRQGRYQRNWEGERGLARMNAEPPSRKPSMTGLAPFTPITEEEMRKAMDDEMRRRQSQNNEESS